MWSAEDHSSPEFEGLHDSNYKSPSEAADVQHFEHHTVHYRSITFGIKELITHVMFLAKRDELIGDWTKLQEFKDVRNQLIHSMQADSKLLTNYAQF